MSKVASFEYIKQHYILFTAQSHETLVTQRETHFSLVIIVVLRDSTAPENFKQILVRKLTQDYDTSELYNVVIVDY